MTAKKKTTAKKTAPKPEPTTKGPEPMDPSVPEVSQARPVRNRGRNAYALDTLIEEVLALFPETTHEVSGRNQFNTHLHVSFHTEEFERLDELLALVEGDHRVEEVLMEAEDRTILVALRPNMRTQDSRDSFGLAEAWDVLAEKYGDAR